MKLDKCKNEGADRKDDYLQISIIKINKISC